MTRTLHTGNIARGLLTTALRGGLLAGCVVATGACNSFDTTRDAGPKATLGDDLYGVMCDRVGASSLPEDNAGDSYRGICHPDAKGKYADKVDASILPKPGAGDEKYRKLSLAKMNAMVAHRSELIRAFNSAFPDIKIKDTQHQGQKIRLHDALMDFSQRLAPLYDANPYYKSSDPLLPATTRALGRLFDALGGHDAPKSGVDKSHKVLEAMQSMTARKAYRPYNVALGAIRPALAYPELRTLTKASLKVLGSGGAASPELQQLLAAAKQEFLTSRPLDSVLPTLTVNKATAQPSRPRSTLEALRKVMLTENDAFAASNAEPSRFIAARDGRGFVVPLGNTPGVHGTVPAPFVDMDGDGYADVDAFGRFVDQGTAPLALQTPFAIPGVQGGAVDAFGRPEKAVYQYLDTSRTVLSAVARDLVPLLDSTELGTGDDAWQKEHETLMYAMSGAYLLYGAREEAQYDYQAEMAGAANPIHGADESCPGCFKYTRFKGEASPLADLAHAAGQVLADKDSDALLLGVLDLVQNHEHEVARALGAMLRIRDIAASHDLLAKNGGEPFAAIKYETPIWDEMAEVLARITQNPGLTANLLASLADPAAVTPHGAIRHQGDTVAAFFGNKDFMTYDPSNLNGPALNTTVGSSSTADPQTPMDWTQPQTGKNRSIMQRSFQVIHDANHAVLCNKDNAVVHAHVAGFNIDWPIVGSNYAECELFRMDNAATFYLDTILPLSHPKHSQMPLNPDTGLSTLLDLGDFIGLNVPDTLQGSSGIQGLTVGCGFDSAPAGCATSQAINRLLYFGADTELYPNMPDHDTNPANDQTNEFVSKMLNAAGTSVCPFDGGGQNTCTDQKGLFRTRDFGTMFAWERLGYFDYLQPTVTAFANLACTPDVSSCQLDSFDGEQMFVDIFDIFWRHWPGPEHGDECNSNGTAKTNPSYCSGAGANSYEPMLAEAMKTDLIPALHEFAIAATQLSKITVARGPNKGQQLTAAEVLEKVTRIIFDPKYAADVHMVDRHGRSGTTWTDGTPQAQLTPFTLFADALHGIDQRFDQACSCSGLSGSALSKCQANTKTCTDDATMRKGQWKRARSQLVDEFLAVDGDGDAAKFRNAATPKALVAIVQTLREQLNANCPDRESGKACAWAKKDLGKKIGDVLSGPLFAGIMDVQEQVRNDPSARRELEKLLSFILVSASQDDAFQSSLASFADILQLLSDDGRFSAIFNAAATASDPQGDKDGPGCATTTIDALDVLAGDEYDRYHVLDTIMPALVTPMDGGTGSSPIEIMMDTISDVNRIDAESQKPLDSDDYRAVWRTMNGFMTDKTRGLEQFYHIIQNRPSE